MYEHFEHNVVGGIPQRIYQCPDCDEAFTQRDSIEFHRYVKHRKDEKPEIPDEWKLFYRPPSSNRGNPLYALELLLQTRSVIRSYVS